MAAVWAAPVSFIGVESHRSPWLTWRYQRTASVTLTGVEMESASSLPGWKDLGALCIAAITGRGLGVVTRFMDAWADDFCVVISAKYFSSAATSASIAGRRSAQWPRRFGDEP